MAKEEKIEGQESKTPAQAAGKPKALTIVPRTKKIEVGGKALTVPDAVVIMKESELDPAHVIKGPVKKTINGVPLSCYVTVDGQRARFDAKGNLV